ncbi:hypothetical protein BDN72DRAFT_879456 [Pluteus cervinus]|uniref:Uncharacterized protein n=1 Tax=Pluteus cervinus TaxID=181527 RepID=A0ACD3AQF6_9AGAR|nr:hypothetical protein BDN72DRAFT_879456 [Pluteus cervinus]
MLRPLFSEHLEIWFRYFDYPEGRLDLVEHPKDANLADLARALAERGLRDPTNPDRTSEEYDMCIWELNHDTRNPPDDITRWMQALADCGYTLEKIATEVTFGPVLRFQNGKDLSKEYLSLVVSAWTPYFNARKEKVEKDSFGFLTRFYTNRYQKLIKQQRSKDTKIPSLAAKLESFCNSQKGDFPIYDGRHPADPGKPSSTFAVPVSLYHPIFEEWRHWAFDRTLEPPAEVIAASARFMKSASVLGYKEEALCDPLQAALRHDIETDDVPIVDSCTSIRIERNGTVHNNWGKLLKLRRMPLHKLPSRC